MARSLFACTARVFGSALLAALWIQAMPVQAQTASPGSPSPKAGAPNAAAPKANAPKTAAPNAAAQKPAAPAESATPQAALPALTVDHVLGEVDGWVIGLSGALGGCFAGASYDNDTMLWMGLGGTQERGFIVLTNPAWDQIQIGRSYDVRLNTPGQTPWRGKATGVARANDEKGFLLTDLKDEMMGALARADQLEFLVENRVVAQLPLTASPSAIAHVIKCQSEYPKLMASLNEPKSSTGTGFFVSWRGHVLTNNHVVDKCKVLEVVRPGAAPVPARLVAVDPTTDLALLQTSLRTHELPAFVPRARIGQSVFLYGFPLTQRLASTGNFVTGGVSAMAGIGDDTSRLQISAPVQPGNSGGPVLDQNGNVIGVVVAVLAPTDEEKAGQRPSPQNANFAIKSSAAMTFLEANNVEPNTKLRTAVQDPAALAEAAKEFTVRVECDLPH